MGIIAKISFLVFFSIFISSCSDSTTVSPPMSSNIVGKVTDRNGNLLNDVNIYFVYHLNDVSTQQVFKINNVDTVSFAYFRVTNVGSGIQVEWGTVSELNNKGFEIQRRLELTDYATIGFVQGSGTSNEHHDYSFSESYVNPGIYYYRIKQIDFDGSYEYSRELRIIYRTFYDTLYQNYPNPFSVATSIRYEVNEAVHCRIELINYYSLSLLLYLFEADIPPGTYKILFNNFYNYPNDIYKLKLQLTKNDSIESEEDIDLLINSTQWDQLSGSKPNIKTVNGKFEVNISSLPLQKIINYTGETSPAVIGQKQVSNLMTFVLEKDGYITSVYEYLVDENNKNEFNFIMESQ